MADSFVEPVNGIEDSNVIPKNGSVAFDIPLYQLETVGGASFPLTLNYKSAMLKEDYGAWTPESPENMIAAGWGINTDSRIFIIQKHPYKYALYLNGILYQLKPDFTKGFHLYYKTVIHSLFHIYYDTVLKYWEVSMEDGTRYQFGKNDDYTKESGTYSAATGTYSQASAEYVAVRNIISHPNDAGVPVNINADNTICRTTEMTLFGTNNWVAPTYGLLAMREKPCGWRLSHIVDSFDNVISFSYIQHISNLAGTDTSKTYSVSSYLYRISVFCKNVLTEKIVFVYGEKDSNEYYVDFLATPRPNGNQQKFEKLYLKKLSRFTCKFTAMQEEPTLWMADQTQLISTLMKPATNIVKRQLNEVQLLATDSLDIQYSPSYKMTYYGGADGVSAGQTGFDDSSHLYFNAKTGAVFGNLKSITYPAGEKREYKYTEHDINSVATTLWESAPSAKTPITISTPYNYLIMIFPNPATATSIFYAYTMTLMGWRKKKLFEAKVVDNYDYERMVSYSENVIGIIAQKIDSNYEMKVFTRDLEGNDVWNDKITRTINGNVDKMHISVSDEGYAYTYASSDTAAGTLYYGVTSDDRTTFETELQMSLSALVKEGLNYRVVIKVLENKCLAFVTTPQTLSAPKPTWFRTTDLHYETYWLKGGGIRKDGSQLPISDMGMPQLLWHSFMAPDPSAITKTAAWYLTGGKLEKMTGVDIIGNFVVLRFQCRGQTAWYYSGNIGFYHAQKDALDSGDWCQVLFQYNNAESFSYLDSNVLTAALVKERPRTLTTWPTLVQSTIESSAQVTENGIIYTVHYSCYKTPDIEKYNTIFCTYRGGSKSDFNIQTNDTDQMLSCVMKDNTFAAFHGKLSDSSLGKAYYYLNNSDSTWHRMNTGSVSAPSLIYNHDAEAVLKMIAILGMVISIALLPFGLSTVGGIICTALSAGLFISAEVTSAILQSSYKSSLNLEDSFFGNRFINDGTTIWFRGQQQDRLTAIGSGTAFQPYDALSGDGVIGNISTNNQQFGHVYNYVPFFTNQKKLYYRRLKNDAVGVPIPIGGLSVGCSDLYCNPLTKNIYAYKDKYIYSYLSEGRFTKAVNTQYPLRHMDACCLLRKGSDTCLIAITGNRVSYSINEGSFIKHEKMSSIFTGTHCVCADCALEQVESSTEATSFYLFYGNEYELVEMDMSAQIFYVIDYGTLDQFIQTLGITDFPFDKLDAAYYDDGPCFIRKNRFVKYNSAGVKTKEGQLGQDWFKEDIDANDVLLDFTNDFMSYYKKSTGDFQLLSHAGGTINDSIRNYAVDTVSFYTDPRNGAASPTSVTKYRYYTDSGTYAAETGTVVYNCVDICTTE